MRPVAWYQKKYVTAAKVSPRTSTTGSRNTTVRANSRRVIPPKTAASPMTSGERSTAAVGPATP
jgi:hypothetical protein